MPTLHVARIAAARPGSVLAWSRPDERIPPLHEAIGVRRAVRLFKPDPVSPSMVREMVEVAKAACLRQWPSETRVLTAVFGDGSGLYEGPRPLGCPLWLPRLREMYVAAPVLFLICGDVTSRQPGHAAGLFHAGALGHALWLSAAYLGLGACAFGGSSAEATAAARERDARLRHLFTIAVGHSMDTQDGGAVR